MPWLLVLPVASLLFAHVPTGTGGEPTIEPEPTFAAGPAEPSSPPAVVDPEDPESPWYGAPALAVDGAVAIGLAGLVHMTNTDSDRGPSAFLYGLTAAYLLAGPVVHLAHGHGLRSAESLLIRVGGLAAGLAATYALSGSTGCEAEVSEHAACPAPYALILAPVSSMVLDDLLLAREPVAQPARTLSTRVLVQPGLAMFGVGGTF